MSSGKRVLREEKGPNGNVTALVEDDGRSIYLYLEGAEGSDFGTRAVWVRNRLKAPWLMEVERMQGGQAPMLQARYVVDPEGGPSLSPDRIEFLWFEDGEGVALLEEGDILAVIPPWSGVQGFAGYARDCALESPFCAPLGTPQSNPDVYRLLSQAASFWNDWDEHTWPKLQEQLLGAYRQAFGRERQVYETGQERFPPALLAQYERDGAWVLATGGMSIRPQPRVDRGSGAGAPFRRIEIAVAVEKALLPDPMPLVRWLAGQATLPWDRYTWLGHGHTVGCSALAAAGFAGVVLSSEAPGAPELHLPHVRGEHVELLWALPITAEEQAIAAAAGGEALLEQLRMRGVQWVARKR
ncbi:suppressor of fused domain protein [Vulgatibacter sp.]|uniref:suppressor of fused domain protein n=1 Tax=Vulgatibacter sp. TaxID=1971226 RepID=UPI003567B998